MKNLKDVEYEYIYFVLMSQKWVRGKSARILGLSRRTLSDKILQIKEHREDLVILDPNPSEIHQKYSKEECEKLYDIIKLCNFNITKITKALKIKRSDVYNLKLTLKRRGYTFPKFTQHVDYKSKRVISEEFLKTL